MIELVDLFESASYYYIVLEHMGGKDLFDYLKNRGFKLQEDRVRDIMRQLLSALEYLQLFGIIHRDIKLENIMMSDFSDSMAIPKLIDFGLARVLAP